MIVFLSDLYVSPMKSHVQVQNSCLKGRADIRDFEIHIDVQGTSGYLDRGFFPTKTYHELSNVLC